MLLTCSGVETDITLQGTLCQGDGASAAYTEPTCLRAQPKIRRLLRAIFPDHGGHEIKTIGDAFLVEFPSTVEPGCCAIEIQKALAEHDATALLGRRLQMRIGLHVGDVVYEENDVLGDGVNIASRIERFAEPGGICVTEDVTR